MDKNARITLLTKGLVQLLKPELTRLRIELESGTIPLLDGKIRNDDGQYWPMVLGLPEEVRDECITNSYKTVGYNSLYNSYSSFDAGPEGYVNALMLTDVAELLEVIERLENVQT